MEPKIMQCTHISGDLEYVAFSDGSVELRNEEQSFIPDEDAAYKLLVSLQCLFPNLPIVDHLNLA